MEQILETPKRKPKANRDFLAHTGKYAPRKCAHCGCEFTPDSIYRPDQAYCKCPACIASRALLRFQKWYRLLSGKPECRKEYRDFLERTRMASLRRRRRERNGLFKPRKVVPPEICLYCPCLAGWLKPLIQFASRLCRRTLAAIAAPHPPAGLAETACGLRRIVTKARAAMAGTAPAKSSAATIQTGP